MHDANARRGEVTEVADSEIWVLMQSLPFCLTPCPYSPLLQELRYRKQIARPLRTQYIESIYGPKYYTVTLTFDFDFDFDDVGL